MKISFGTNVAPAKGTVEPKSTVKLFNTTRDTTRDNVNGWLVVVVLLSVEESVNWADIGRGQCLTPGVCFIRIRQPVG